MTDTMLQPSGYGSLRSLLLDNIAGLGSRPGRAGGGARCCGSVGAGALAVTAGSAAATGVVFTFVRLGAVTGAGA